MTCKLTQAERQIAEILEQNPDQIDLDYLSRTNLHKIDWDKIDWDNLSHTNTVTPNTVTQTHSNIKMLLAISGLEYLPIIGLGLGIGLAIRFFRT